MAVTMYSTPWCGYCQRLQTVPTLVFADGSAATNPSLKQVQEKVAATG